MQLDFDLDVVTRLSSTARRLALQDGGGLMWCHGTGCVAQRIEEYEGRMSLLREKETSKAKL